MTIRPALTTEDMQDIMHMIDLRTDLANHFEHDEAMWERFQDHQRNTYDVTQGRDAYMAMMLKFYDDEGLVPVDKR